jgi:hypothetical protein
MQYRCAAFAKMGAIALSYDMYAWGESVLMTGDLLLMRPVLQLLFKHGTVSGT